VHRNATFLLASWCGLNDPRELYPEGVTQAFMIAWADYNVDKYSLSDPGAHVVSAVDPERIKNRRIFHFPVPRGDRYTRRLNYLDPYTHQPRVNETAQYVVNLALNQVKQGKANPFLFGVGLHVLQDSYAHEGYPIVEGHALGGTAPDYPITDPAKAVEMAKATYDALNQWSLANRGAAGGCKMAWADVEQRITPLMQMQTPDDATLEQVFHGAADKENGTETTDAVDQRWRLYSAQEATRLLGRQVAPDGQGDNDPRVYRYSFPVKFLRQLDGQAMDTDGHWPPRS
jgi:hypothetical protein